MVVKGKLHNRQTNTDMTWGILSLSVVGSQFWRHFGGILATKFACTEISSYKHGTRLLVIHFVVDRNVMSVLVRNGGGYWGEILSRRR